MSSQGSTRFESQEFRSDRLAKPWMLLGGIVPWPEVIMEHRE
jgi:hypothetical protein